MEQIAHSIDKSEVLLSVRDLKVWFELRRLGIGHAGYIRAVDGLSFDLRRGAAVAIVGESGCGKSSLMRTILALYKPTAGEIVFDGKKFSETSDFRWYRSLVGYVQQDPYGALPPFMSVQQILSEPLIIANVEKNERKRRVHQVLEEVKMSPVEDFLSKFPHMLSGGQQQRVVVARAMILEPRLLVADEPVSMLDASVRVEVLKLLQKLQESHNLSVIYVTHDLSTVRYFSENIFVMYAGKIIEKAQVADLITTPLHPYTWALLTATSEPDARNATMMKEIPPGEPPNLAQPPPGCRFHPRCSKIIKGLCEVQEPPEFEAQSGHQVACWLYQ